MQPDGSEQLHRKLRDARESYQRAMAEYKRLITISADTTHLSDPALVDGNHALRRALKVHTMARLKYEKALQEFTDLILHGKTPHSE